MSSTRFVQINHGWLKLNAKAPNASASARALKLGCVASKLATILFKDVSNMALFTNGTAVLKLATTRASLFPPSW